MKVFITLLLTLSIFLFFSSIDAENDILEFFGYSKNDCTTLAQFHEFEAKIKAERLDLARADYNAIQQVTRYDMSEYDVSHYRLDMEIDLFEEYVDSASLTMTARSLIEGLETIELDFVDSIIYPIWYPDSIFLAIDSVYNSSGQLLFSHENHKVTIQLDHTYNTDEEFVVTVRYHGHPFATYKMASGSARLLGRGLAFGYQNHFFDETSTIPVAYTDCQPYDSRRWWPCKDSPSDKIDSMDINITVDHPFHVATNGRLDQIIELPGSPSRRTFKYKMTYPIYTSVVSLAISDYIVWNDWYYYNDGNDSMPIVNHTYPFYIEEAQEIWVLAPEILGIFADAFCEYPFINDKYGHAQYENFGMEHQTITAAPPSEFAHTIEFIVLHEMTHTWWGNMITCRTWHDVWLHEGLGTYSEAIYFEGIGGTDAYHNHMASLEYFGNRSVYVYDTTYASDVYNIVVYHKGAWVIHMLRGILGDELFFNLMHAYCDSEFKYSTVTTEEFIEFCNNFTAMNLNDFFDDWVYGTMYPTYAATSYIEQDLSDGLYWTFLNLRQTQTYGPEVFEMPVDLRFYSGDEIIFDTTVNNDLRFQRFVFKTADEPDSILVDPDNWILGTSFNIPWSYYLLPLPLDTAQQFAEYRDTVFCEGGSGLNQFAVISGSMPDGLSLNSETGEISGIPEESGEFFFVVESDDNYSSYLDEYEFSIFVKEGTGWPGDANHDNNVDILDVVFIINYKYKNGPAPTIPELADPNVDCNIDILDVVFLVNYKYKGGPAPELGCAFIE